MRRRMDLGNGVTYGLCLHY